MTDPVSDDVFDQIFRDARTFGYFVDKPVREETLRVLYDLLKWGPTSSNQQPLRISWCVTPEARDRLAAHCPPGNANKIRSAPLAAVLGMDLDFVRLLPRLYPHADERAAYGNDHLLIAKSAFRNSSLQGAYLIIAARMLGLDVNPMSGFDEEAVNADFFSGTSIRVNFIATLGHGDPSKLHPRGPRLEFEEANVVL